MFKCYRCHRETSLVLTCGKCGQLTCIDCGDGLCFGCRVFGEPTTVAATLVTAPGI